MSRRASHLCTPAQRALYDAEYINLITYRKNGNPVATPSGAAITWEYFMLRPGLIMGRSNVYATHHMSPSLPVA
ncbi:hypothetical protein [Dictyobacter kobayashii]|uniref:hypothetical protein n=1 Tax=Dictyobacter kobayashii TaxID=2014872 RepID=UPI000F83A818|nr:hypothetical protein [Dictyobacter kobayashii]